MKEVLTHKGKVVAVSPEVISVEILVEEACSACHAKGLCGMAGYKEKLIEVPATMSRLYQVGDEVEVCLKGSLGLKAVWIAYAVPLILLVAVLFGCLALGAGEVVSAAVGIAAAALYYFVVWLMRDKLEKEYIFTIK
ncbi:MAG: SoxR reducing system RseC family protein [Bacteroidales bacterium]|nr:SoxR reducing system RseC family protein [Bacteroidales bacterium]